MASRPMQAVVISQPGGPEVLKLEPAEMPVPAEDELLVKVEAAGVNRPDVAQRLGRYPVPADANPVPGLEVAGVVIDAGSTVESFAVGQRVCALTHGGGYATYCRVKANQTLAIPSSMSFVEAAAFPEVAFTVEFNMMMRAGLRAGEAVLIHGGSSGIGAHAIQRAKAVGAQVLVTVGSEEKRAFCLGLGADYAFNYKTQDWAAEVVKAVSSVDVVLDMVGGEYVNRNISCLAADGRYALISLQGGRKVEVDLEPLLRRRLTLVGSTLRPLPPSQKAAIATEVERSVMPLVEAGKIRSTIYRTFSLSEAAAAHQLMESGEHAGKIVLTMSDV